SARARSRRIEGANPVGIGVAGRSDPNLHGGYEKRQKQDTCNSTPHLTRALWRIAAACLRRKRAQPAGGRRKLRFPWLKAVRVLASRHRSAVGLDGLLLLGGPEHDPASDL